jgi:DNA mismatch repair protein MutS
MIYKPYKKIFTRIPSGDDIMKGQSTFTVEVNELRNILKRADNDSLVIGDELCSGTETISAISIVSAGIIELCKRNCSFILATHLHDLTKISKIKNLNRLKTYNLSVIYNDETGKLIYNRKLNEGQGNTLYGLEVCKSLNLGNEFIELANEIRREVLGLESSILNTKTSQYNNNKFIDVCSICNEKSIDVHHIKEQHIADKDGFINSIHKNDLHNLINVCKKCHDNIHNNKIEIKGYIQTENGIELDYEINKNNSEELLEESLILPLVQNGKKIPEILKILEKDHNIKSSRYKISKIISSKKIK